MAAELAASNPHARAHDSLDVAGEIEVALAFAQVGGYEGERKGLWVTCCRAAKAQGAGRAAWWNAGGAGVRQVGKGAAGAVWARGGS